MTTFFRPQTRVRVETESIPSAKREAQQLDEVTLIQALLTSFTTASHFHRCNGIKFLHKTIEEERKSVTNLQFGHDGIVVPVAQRSDSPLEKRERFFRRQTCKNRHVCVKRLSGLWSPFIAFYRDKNSSPVLADQTTCDVDSTSKARRHLPTVNTNRIYPQSPGRNNSNCLDCSKTEEGVSLPSSKFETGVHKHRLF